MDDGRCPDAAWAGAVKSLRAGSAAALHAAEEKDLAATKAAFKQVTEGCATCHEAAQAILNSFEAWSSRLGDSRVSDLPASKEQLRPRKSLPTPNRNFRRSSV